MGINYVYTKNVVIFGGGLDMACVVMEGKIILHTFLLIRYGGFP